MSPRVSTPARRRAALLATALVGALLAALVVLAPWDDGAPARLAAVPATEPAPAPSDTTPDTGIPPTPGTTPAPAPPALVVDFPAAECVPSDAGAATRPLGLGIPRPARMAGDPLEKAVFQAAYACLERITGKKPVLRTQLPIDVTRRLSQDDHERPELSAFATLLRETGSTGIVSIRSHDFTNCKGTGEQAVAARGSLPPGGALATCEYPSLPVYEQLFKEVHDTLEGEAPGATVFWSPWNEPDHPAFTLEADGGDERGAYRAGRYWTVAAGIAGADRVLAGEFSDRSYGTLLRLRDAYLRGTGGLEPALWAIHPYRDLTSGEDGRIEAEFGGAVGPAPVWVTETTARLTGRRSIGGRAGAQRSRGEQLRDRLGNTTTPLVLYLLTPPAPPRSDEDDGWDSALADRQGRARPFVCGLAGLPAERCTGSAAAFGG